MEKIKALHVSSVEIDNICTKINTVIEDMIYEYGNCHYILKEIEDVKASLHIILDTPEEESQIRKIDSVHVQRELYLYGNQSEKQKHIIDMCNDGWQIHFAVNLTVSYEKIINK